MEIQVGVVVPLAHATGWSAKIPVVRSAPYEYGVPGAPPVADLHPSRTDDDAGRGPGRVG